MGEFHKLAIHGLNLNDTIISYRNPDGKYENLHSEVRSLKDFLVVDLYQPEIDYLFMDIEGSEYSILKEMVANGSLTYDVQICHITVELHGNYKEFGVDKKDYGNLIINLFETTGFIPIWAPDPQNHQRLFITNAQSLYCIQRYFIQWCREPDLTQH